MSIAQSTSLDMAFDDALQLAFPPVMVRLFQLLLHPAPSFSSIANFLQQDPVLAGKVLHIANSASYGFNQKITELQRAAIVIGTSDLFKLVIALSLQKNLHPFEQRDPELIFNDWRISLWGALSAEAIAGYLCPGQEPQAYLAALLRDLPLFLALCRTKKPAFLQGRRLVALPGPDDAAQELLTWGRTHAEQAHAIFLYWDIPHAMAEAVLAHHDLAAVSSHPPLTRSLIYATRWAELLHDKDADPGALIAFELTLAAELGLDSAGMERFRRACTDKFNRQLGQLGIAKGKPESRLYEQSLARIQSYYFLVLETLGDISLRPAHSIASILQQKLRLHWDLSSWDLHLRLPTDAGERLFHCEGNTLLDSSGAAPPFSAQGRTLLPISSGKANYGSLVVPEAFADPEQSSLPIFTRMMGMRLEEHARRQNRPVTENSMAALPFMLARLDKKGRIEDASKLFLDTFGLSETPVGRSAGDLLEEQLGLSRKHLALKGPESESGAIFSVPEGSFPGTPLFLAHTENEGLSGGSLLLLSDLPKLSALQTLVLSQPGLMEPLFGSLAERICVVSEQGQILWADPAAQDLPGRNIFSLVQPEENFAGTWTPAFLADLRDPASLHGSFNKGRGPMECSLRIFPLGKALSRQYLIVLGGLGRPAPLPDSADMSPVKPRDSLTRLYDYSQFHIFLQHIAEIGKKKDFALGLLFCEIAALRTINREHGVHKGDAVLRGIAKNISALCRPGKDYPCRYGPDVFAVLVSRATGTLMESLAEKLRALTLAQKEHLARLGLGLALIAPGEPTRPILDLAKKAARQALDTQDPFLWA